MDQETKNALTAQIIALLNGGADFITAKAPTVAQEVILAARFESTLILACALTCLIGSLYGIWRLFQWTRTKGFNPFRDSGAVELLGFVAGFVGVVSVVVIGASLPSVVKAWFTPHVLVIEWLRGLL